MHIKKQNKRPSESTVVMIFFILIVIVVRAVAVAIAHNSIDSIDNDDRLCFLHATSRAACEMTLALQLGNMTPAAPAMGNVCCSQLFDFVKLFVLFESHLEEQLFAFTADRKPAGQKWSCVGRSLVAFSQKLLGWQARKKQLDPAN
jgi:hypothetical protein